MKKAIFCCPKCKNSLKRKKEYFFCPECKENYSFTGNIYKFFDPDCISSKDRKTGEFFNKIFKIFSPEDKKGSVEEISLFKLFGFSSKDFRNKIILDAGTGYGRIVKEISGYKPKGVFGMDLALHSLVAASEFVNKKEAFFVHADLNRAPFPAETFDWVISLGVIHHLENFDGALKNLLILCKKKGKILLAIQGRNGFFPSVRFWLRKITVKIPFSAVEKIIKILPVSPALKYIICDTFWVPICNQKSFKQMKEILGKYGATDVEKLYYSSRKKGSLWDFFQGEGYLYILATKK